MIVHDTTSNTHVAHSCLPHHSCPPTRQESKLYGAHFKDVDFSAKSTKMTFGDDDE